jgi:predicted transcriptional regulator of viral defense system
MVARGITKYTDLPSWVDSRQAQGLYFFTREEALKTINFSEDAFKHAAARLVRKGRIVRVHGGFFIIVPLEYAATGLIPPEWFIGDLMEYIGQPFYVGLLSAAVFHGAAHQQPQQFQVVTTKLLREIRIKNQSIRFFVKTGFEKTPRTQFKVQTGFIPVSTPEATIFDLLRYSRWIGGLDRVYTVLQELGEKVDPSKLLAAAKADENLTYAQRAGWLLEKAGFSKAVEKLAGWLVKKHLIPVKLDPGLETKGAPKDNRWSIVVNAKVEGDL